MNLEADVVELHFAELPEHGSFAALLAVESASLTDDEVAAAHRFVFERDRLWYVASHAFLRRTLARTLGTAPREIEIVRDANGRPELIDRRLRFNLSHTAGLAAVAVTASADVGVDVECIRNVDRAELEPVVFTDGERAEWNRSDDDFFDLWTLKESYLKARGVGLTADLHSFSFSKTVPPRLQRDASAGDTESWHFLSVAPTSRHRAAAAVRSATVRWIVHQPGGFSDAIWSSGGDTTRNAGEKPGAASRLDRTLVQVSAERASVVTVNDQTRPRRILIVDDEDDIREVASISLEISEGWHVAVASSVADALRTAELDPPDAILLDVMMPDVDGPTGLLDLRSRPTTRLIPVIFLTAKAGERDLRKLLDLGAQGVIAKPFDPMALGGQVRELLHWK